MSNKTIQWEETISGNDIADEVNEMQKNGWQIISVCVTEFRINGPVVYPTKAIIVCSPFDLIVKK